ncbi:5-oxoprolinase subunit PxpB [Fluviispira vulneris]|uniref:5-oxoprolinase subunit PxpB n=1 Tax=Fluviispira vulneris TaxID=2763012 RepID=UPI001644608C|nr:5-oxoprolinase subunit PxpB [Fluviispira vulneris]
MNLKRPRFFILNESSLSLELEPPAELFYQKKLWWLAKKLKLNPQVIDVVIGMNNFTIVINPLIHHPENFLFLLESLWQQAESIENNIKEVIIPVKYGKKYGPDLIIIANNTGLTFKEIIELHCSGEYFVYFLGFQPGFPYLGGLPKQLHTARKNIPNIAIPAGSVGIGGSQTGIYPSCTPGGWNIIGHTDFILFKPDSSEPTTLLPGDKVRFVEKK